MKIKKWHIFSGLVVFLMAASGLGLWRVYLYPKQNLFAPSKIAENFRSMESIFPSKPIAKSSTPYKLRENIRELNVSYKFGGKSHQMSEMLDRTSTTGILVVKNDVIVYEHYFRGNTANARNTSWSMAKSFISALVGIAIAEGKISSVNDPITKYVPELIDSGYNNVPIKHVLQMSSGVRFNEGYSNPKSDINQLMSKLFLHLRPMDRVIADFPSEYPSGKKFQYMSLDSHVLGLLLRRATGKSIADYFQEKLWQPLGAESEASWLTDLYGTEITFCGLNATLRDYAKFGLLYLHEGKLNGKQILSEQWVKESITPDRPDLQANATDAKEYAGFGYQYQWWIPPDTNGDFVARGHRGQFIYVSPKRQVVIVKTSAAEKSLTSEIRLETIALFRAIADVVF
ncbi:MAG: serine hydrolase domain-containing protein [Pseudanabaena sp.]